MANTAVARITETPALDQVARPLSEAVVAAYRNAGEVGGAIKNAMHGVWLGHPLHPVLTDIPLGAWTTALALDATAAATGDEGYARAGDVAVAVGLAGAMGAAVTGLTDFSETDGRARRIGLIHGLMNIGATALFATAWLLRRKDSRAAGQACTVAGYGVALGAAYLGGDLVFGERIGVTHAAIGEPEDFTAIASSAAVANGTMQRVKKDDVDLLVARHQGRACALAHPCAHLGGPLSEGQMTGDGTVICPWHGSEFRLQDGAVINGPSTHPQPCFAVRERGGQIEVGPETRR